MLFVFSLLQDYKIMIYSIFQSSFNGSNIFGTMELFIDMGSSRYWELIIAPGQEANEDNNLKLSFRSFIMKVC